MDKRGGERFIFASVMGLWWVFQKGDFGSATFSLLVQRDSCSFDVAIRRAHGAFCTDFSRNTCLKGKDWKAICTDVDVCLQESRRCCRYPCSIDASNITFPSCPSRERRFVIQSFRL